MNPQSRDVYEFRLEQVEKRMNRVEQFLLGFLVFLAIGSITSTWLLVQLRSDLAAQDVKYDRTERSR